MKKYRQFELWRARQVGKMCTRLHLTAPTIASYEIHLDGEPIMTSKSNSWVRNMINWMAFSGLFNMVTNDNASFFADGYLTLRKTDGAVSGMNNQCFFVAEPPTSSILGAAYGIQVGTSDVAESFDDYKLGAIVGHGTTAGTLYKAAQQVLSRTWDAANRKWVLLMQRTFTNNSGAAISVKELGILTTGFWQYGPGTAIGPLLLLRDVLPQPVVVNNGQTLTVNYTIEYNY